MEIGIHVDGAVLFPDEAAHSRAALRRELAVEDNDNSLLCGGGDDGGLEEEILHLVFLVQVQSPLRRNRDSSEYKSSLYMFLPHQVKTEEKVQYIYLFCSMG